jgi:hypothetical protein
LSLELPSSLGDNQRRFGCGELRFSLFDVTSDFGIVSGVGGVINVMYVADSRLSCTCSALRNELSVVSCCHDAPAYQQYLHSNIYGERVFGPRNNVLVFGNFEVGFAVTYSKSHARRVCAVENFLQALN